MMIFEKNELQRRSVLEVVVLLRKINKTVGYYPFEWSWSNILNYSSTEQNKFHQKLSTVGFEPTISRSSL